MALLYASAAEQIEIGTCSSSSLLPHITGGGARLTDVGKRIVFPQEPACSQNTPHLMTSTWDSIPDVITRPSILLYLALIKFIHAA